MGIVLLALGWASITLSVRYDLVGPSLLALEVIGGALLLVEVAIRILAAKEIPSTYHIKNLVTSAIYSKQGILCTSHYLPDRWSRRALAGRARIHLGLWQRSRSLLDSQT